MPTHLPAKKRLVLLGATGSIGDNTLKVVRSLPENLQVVGIAAARNWQKLAAIAKEFQVVHVAIYEENACLAARESGLFPAGTQFYAGLDGLMAIAVLDNADMVISAVVGTTGLRPTLAAIEAGKDIALASKELLVLAGKFVMAAATRMGVRLLPIDSEHNAIFQCLAGGTHREVRRLLLTASGGPFLHFKREQMATITPLEARMHPNWSMGPKVTVDSSTMANKSLEMIEARWLFGVPPQQIQVVIHPQSIIHSMVEFVDGSILAQLCPPSMTFAIQHALMHPHRLPGCMKSLDFSQVMKLEFLPPDESRFPLLRQGREALEAGGVAPAVYNAANEVAVSAFLDNRIPYLSISDIVARTQSAVHNFEPRTLEEVLNADAEARSFATATVGT
ncbi:MAG: 1-deoxy-D-xylulose-5-phosphate reductoisomerase [Verrucomicrobiota bacterium]|nr:1-deoxy-D-xylulose-5-phosphate reductoisomerase [Verrucomicrobiota bacterium]